MSTPINHQPYLFFDAGGTLIFPDFEYFSNLARDAGIAVTPDQLFEIYCGLIYEIDQEARATGRLPIPFPKGFATALFEGLTDQDTLVSIANLAEARNRRKSLWTSSPAWVADTLSELRSRGYKMSVISNADGRVEQMLVDLDLRQYFERVFDSTIEGVSKPDQRFFNIALDALQLKAGEALYIGDVYFFDVWGANSAGLGCVHLDPLGLYVQWPGLRIPSIRDLPGLFSSDSFDPAGIDLHPAEDFPLIYENP